MSLHIAIDPGSSHMGKKKFVEDLISAADSANVNSIKFQLFPNEKRFTDCGNVYMSRDLFDHAYRFARKLHVKVTASVFGKEEAEFLAGYKVPYVKFAYSMRHETNMIEGWLNRGTIVVVTTDVMTKLPEHKNLVKLYTATNGTDTLYPCTYQIEFEGLFPQRFQGFSDHCLTETQACRAVREGAIWIEKHAGLMYNEVDCPDKHIQWDIGRLHLYVQAVRKASA